MGGIVPMLEGRIGPGWDQIGARTSDEDYQKLKKSLKKRPLDYFKESFYCDTAVFGGKPATECGLAFYPNDKIVFASDCPFDPEKGTYYIRETLKIFDSLDLSKDEVQGDHARQPGEDHRPQAGEVVAVIFRRHIMAGLAPAICFKAVPAARRGCLGVAEHVHTATPGVNPRALHLLASAPWTPPATCRLRTPPTRRRSLRRAHRR